jgi:hypothetical protein
MSKKILQFGIVIISLLGFGSFAFGAFNDYFLSIQLAEDPTNGECLITDGTDNVWGDCGSGSEGLTEITSVGEGISLVADEENGYVKSVSSTNSLITLSDEDTEVHLTASSSPTFGQITATLGTSTITNLSITSAISILGEYFTNFTNYVRSLFTAGTGILISSGLISVDEANPFNWTATHTFTKPPVSLEIATTSTQIPNWGQVSSISQGLIVKEAVRVATVAAITTSTEQTIDGVELVAGDRVLVKNQAQSWRNGIYVVAVGDWSRAEDSNTDEEVKQGTFAPILEGTQNATKLFYQYQIDPTIDVDALNYSELSSAVNYEASNGISESSNVFSLGGTLIQNTSINNANYGFDFNLNGTGDFNVTDNGTPALTVDDSGKTTITNLVANWLSATSSLDYWFNASTTIKVVDLASSWITGILDIANGGTGGATAQEARTNILPSQTGNTGEALLTDGSDTYWGTVSTDGGSSVTSTFGNTKMLVWVANGSSYSTWTDMSPDPSDFLSASTTKVATNYYKKFDLTNSYRFRTSRSLSVAGYAGSYIYLQYSYDRVNWYDAGNSDQYCTLVGTGNLPCPWATLVTGARTDVWLRYRGDDGNGAIDPRFYNLVTEFTTYASTEEENATTTDSFVFVASPTSNQTWSNMPLAKSGTYYNGFGTSYHYRNTNLYKANRYRILARIATSTTSVNYDPISTMRIDVQYSYNKTNWYNLNSGLASPGVGSGELDISQTPNEPLVGDWVDVAEGGKGNVWLRFVGYGGNGVKDILFRNLEIQFETYLNADVTRLDANWNYTSDYLTPATSTTGLDINGTSAFATTTLGSANNYFTFGTRSAGFGTSAYIKPNTFDLGANYGEWIGALAITEGEPNAGLSYGGMPTIQFGPSDFSSGAFLTWSTSTGLTSLSGYGNYSGFDVSGTTTLDFKSYIGDSDTHMWVKEQYIMGMPIPLIGFTSNNFNVGDDIHNYGAMEDGLIFYENLRNPSLMFVRKSDSESVNISYVTTTNQMRFTNADSYYFDNSIEIVDGGDLTVDGNLTVTSLATPAGSFLAVDPNGLVIATTTPILVESDPIWTATSSNYFTLADWYATTTDGLDEGLSNKYYTQARVWDDILASTTLVTTLNNANTAYGWGNWATGIWASSTLATILNNAVTAYDWGDHALGGYLTSLTGGLDAILGNTTSTNLYLSGWFKDSYNSIGTDGQVLQSTGTSTKWVSTSTLGFSGGSSYWTQSGTDLYYTSGKVGIGKTNPSVALDVNGQGYFFSATYPPLTVSRSLTGTNASYGVLKLMASTSADMADNFGSHIDFNILDSAQVENTVGRVGTVRNGADNIGALVFQTANGSTPTEKMRITGAGKVGIGTSTPSSLLHVKASTDTWSAASLLVDGVSSGGSAIMEINKTYGHRMSGLRFSTLGTENWYLGTTYNGGANEYGFSIGSSYLKASSSLYIDYTTKYVGIGDTTPAQLFTVGNGDLFTVDSSGNAIATKYSVTGSGSFYGTHEKCFTMSSTTLATGKTNIPLWYPYRGITVVEERCQSTDGTSVVVTVSDGTNNMDSITCGTSLTKDSSLSNNTWNADERMEVDIGTVTGAVNYVNYCIVYKEN